MAPLTRTRWAGPARFSEWLPMAARSPRSSISMVAMTARIRKRRWSRTRLATCMARPPAGGPCQAGQGTLFQLSVGCAPQITAQPASQVVLGGANVMLSVAAFGARPFWYQWQKNGTNLVDGGNLAGATNRNLTLANVTLADAGTYSVSVSNALGSAPSTGAHLTVVYPPAFLSTVQSNCTLTLTWSTMAGQQYRLQYKPALAATNWTYLWQFDHRDRQRRYRFRQHLHQHTAVLSRGDVPADSVVRQGDDEAALRRAGGHFCVAVARAKRARSALPGCSVWAHADLETARVA